MSKKIRILGTTVSFNTENDVSIIGFGNDAISPDNYIIITRFDDGAVDDSIGIQSHLSEVEVSNAIKAVYLKESECVIEVKESKEKQVGFTTAVIQLKDANTDYKSLMKFIKYVFASSSTKVQVS